MINLTYDTWQEACNLISVYAKKFGKYYLQLYPFFKYNNLKDISSENYFNKYILTGAILNNYENFKTIDNYCRKNDGSTRKRLLITPIIYLYYLAIGLHISKHYTSCKNDNIYVKYAGDFQNSDLHYRNSYQSFTNTLIDNANEYKYYIKLDIKDFFNCIDISILNKQISNKMKFNQKEQLILKELLLFCGNGTFPQTECGVTSSFLATIVYFDIVDNRLYNYLNKHSIIKNFKVCRYVDDLYIFIDMDGRLNTEKIENEIFNLYDDLIYKLKLSINREKSHFRKSNDIFQDLKTFSLLAEDYVENVEMSEYKMYLQKFLTELCDEAVKNNMNHKKYLDLINKNFNDPNSVYQCNQILSSIIYKNMDWLQNTKIVTKMTKIIDNDFNVIGVDPRRLVCLIVNTHDEDLICKLLNKLYLCFENNEDGVLHCFISIQYLLYRNFVSIKLLNKMKVNHPEIVDFINNFYKDDWRKTIISQDTESQITKLDFMKTPISFFKFLEIIEYKRNNVLQAQSYNKNYFDSVSISIELTKGYISEISKVSYTKRELKELYFTKLGIDLVSWTTISNLCDRRNSNPLCHANCNVLMSKNDITSTIKKDIEELNTLITEILENI